MDLNIYPGEFYFKLTSNGNLVGEFVNRDPNCIIATESAVRSSMVAEGQEPGFEGTYHSTWFEENKAEAALLEITPDRDRSNQVRPRRYRLEWWNLNRNHVLFHGYGFVADHLLVGHYGNGAEEDVRPGKVTA